MVRCKVFFFKFSQRYTNGVFFLIFQKYSKLDCVEFSYILLYYIRKYCLYYASVYCKFNADLTYTVCRNEINYAGGHSVEMTSKTSAPPPPPQTGRPAFEILGSYGESSRYETRGQQQYSNNASVAAAAVVVTWPAAETAWMRGTDGRSKILFKTRSSPPPSSPRHRTAARITM